MQKVQNVITCLRFLALICKYHKKETWQGLLFI